MLIVLSTGRRLGGFLYKDFTGKWHEVSGYNQMLRNHVHCIPDAKFTEQRMISVVKKQHEFIWRSSGDFRWFWEEFGSCGIWNLDAKIAIWTLLIFSSFNKHFKMRSGLLADWVGMITRFILYMALSLHCAVWMASTANVNIANTGSLFNTEYCSKWPV